MSDRQVGRIRKIVDWVVGLTLIVIGVIGGFVPILQGWVFILAGLAVLASHSRWARALLEVVRGWGRRAREKLRKGRADSTDTDSP